MTTETTTGTATSADGTTIAYERSGTGPVLILIAQALATRSDNTKLAALLSQTHTVVNYDRRGRGESGDTPPYNPKREVEDVGALLHAFPGAALFGSSSGAVLALDAATSMEVAAVVAYEPPLIVDASRPPVPHSLADDIDKLVDEGHPAAATRLFFTHALGAGWLMLGFLMLLYPIWRGMVGMARTAAYDARLCRGLQDGGPLATERWRVRCPVLVAVGENTEEFMLASSTALAEMLGARREVVKGADHSSPVMNPKALVPLINEFLEEGIKTETAAACDATLGSETASEMAATAATVTTHDKLK